MSEGPTAETTDVSRHLESRPLKIFISYRRSDTRGQAFLLRKELDHEFGSENVFVDVADLEPGTNWVKVINERVAACDVLIALIGSEWAAIATERARRRVLDHREDVVRIEIEAALRRGSRLRIVPVLVDDADMPSSDQLPRPLRPLTSIVAMTLRHTRWDDDLQRLIEWLNHVAGEIAKPRDDDEAGAEELANGTANTTGGQPVKEAPDVHVVPPDVVQPHVASLPDGAHYQKVAALMARGDVVPFLGSGVNAADRVGNWQSGCGSLPDSKELAAHLAGRFEFRADSADLAAISQYVSNTMGPKDLYKSLRQTLTAECPPSSVLRFLARVPAMLEELGRPHYQLIVTTSYDDALERAFDDADEPYDLAVYMAGGEQKGTFVHVPFDGEPRHVSVANEYVAFPSYDYGELERTVIVKIHGAVDNVRAKHSWRENYVITEDDYIDYLSKSPAEKVIPPEMLSKMHDSHFLFLGHTVRDWSLRVFLQRIWGEQRLGAKSWAVQRRPQAYEREYWNEFGVDLFAVPLDEYVTELGAHLAATKNARALQ